jgi:RNA polymerase sigma factor (sigma-70 family)
MMERTRVNILMEMASSGDDAAFSALAAAVQDELYRLACALGLKREDAAEAVQETLLRAYSHRSRWKAGSDAMPWLCGIAVNVVRECIRRERRNTACLRAAQLELPGAETLGEGLTESRGLDADQLQALGDAVSQLPQRQREAIACRYLRRMSIAETAVAMGCAPGTVKSAVSAGLERLRELLKDRSEKH